MAEQRVDFEASLKALEEIVSKMESGDLSLEDSLNAFEQGVKLSRDCQSALEQAEQRVTQLIEKNGKIESQPFDALEGSAP
ncbi:MAG TPA: exodeoxyribonuclease VII small subunit [Pseudomonadales bacterium]|nr:exodeoxyribonuclease VII small subunit [Pseudomonadales bacterium]